LPLVWLLLCLFRRDVMADGWGDAWAGELGVKATTKFGLGAKKQRNRKNDRNIGFAVGSIVSAL